MFLPYNPRSIAETIYAALDEAVRIRDRASLAIPGGSSPGPVLSALAGLLEDWILQRLHLCWVDERAVPVGHEDRNDQAMLAHWRAGGAEPAHVHPMPAERSDLEAAAMDYAGTIRSATGDGIFDVVLLGIGPDGHIASLFPDHPGLDQFAEVFPVIDSPKPPPRRLTLSLPVLARARQRLVLVQGEQKGAVAERVRAGERGPQLPVSLLPEQRTVWYCDEDAAARLRG